MLWFQVLPRKAITASWAASPINSSCTFHEPRRINQVLTKPSCNPSFDVCRKSVSSLTALATPDLRYGRLPQFYSKSHEQHSIKHINEVFEHAATLRLPGIIQHSLTILSAWKVALYDVRFLIMAIYLPSSDSCLDLPIKMELSTQLLGCVTKAVLLYKVHYRLNL